MVIIKGDFMEKLFLVLTVLIILMLSSCRMFSALDTLVGAVNAAGEYVIEEIEKE